jgi:hypothetical protein
MIPINVEVYDVTKDGYPTDKEHKKGHIFFFFDGCVVSGWPINPPPKGWTCNPNDVQWEANDDVGRSPTVFHGVRYWLRLPDKEWGAMIRSKLIT